MMKHPDVDIGRERNEEQAREKTNHGEQTAARKKFVEPTLELHGKLSVVVGFSF